MTGKIRDWVFCLVLAVAALVNPALARAQSEQPAPVTPAPGYAITGTLVQAKGTPAAEQTVYFFVVRDGKIQGDADLDLKTGAWRILMPAATSDARGRFRLELPSESFARFAGLSDHFTLGGFVGVAQKDGKLDWILTREVLRAGKPLRFGAGSFPASRELALGRLTLGPGEFLVTGKLVDSAGVPVKDRPVYLLLLQNGKALGNMRLSSKGLEVDMPHGVTDAGGQFQIRFEAGFVAKQAGARVQGFTVGWQKGTRLEAAHQEGKVVEFGLDMLNRRTGRLDLGAVALQSK